MKPANQSRLGTKRNRSVVVGLLLLAGLAGCSSGGGSDTGGGLIGGPIIASFAPSGTAQSADLVRLSGSATADLFMLQVVISGQTASDDLFAFAFDLVLSNSAVASYVDGSVEFGTALTLEPEQGRVALASQSGNRITVGVSKLGGGGNGVGPTEETIVTLLFRVTQRGSTTIAVDQTPPANPGALESDEETPAPGVRFDSAAALISGS